MRVLVVNTGSSSVEITLVGPDDEVVARTRVEHDAGDTADGGTGAISRGVADVLGGIPPDAVGHRVVHGGAEFTGPVVVDDTTREAIARWTPFARLHQPRNLRGIDATRDALPGVPTVACFDTAFHRDLPVAAATYALPARWRDTHGLRRFGFHGLSHGWVTRRAAAIVGDPGGLRVLSCHLGSGASLCASEGGRSLDTTMGLTPLEGLVMSSRSGTVDPGLVLWLVDAAGVPASEVARVLETESGLAGLTGGTGDMRQILEDREAGDEDAAAAYDVYLHRLVREAAGMVAALGGLDVVVFTGGVGENAPQVRADAARGLGFCGVTVDADRNETAQGPETDLTAHGATVTTLLVESREDLEIARQVRDLLDRTAN